MTHPPLLLASSSTYRQALLKRLGLPFTADSPDIDESPRPGEQPESLALRLSAEKAAALASRYPQHWIIGSDQVASLADGTLLTKPGDFDTAFRQLTNSSGQSVTFHTGLTLLDASTGEQQSLCESYTAHFRELTDGEIKAYLNAEEPYDCAGSFKMEGLGITLFSALDGRDPNSLIGLPLIALVDMLKSWGVDPLLNRRK